MNKYEKIYNEAARNGGNPKWMNTCIRPLAADLEELTGLKAEVSGPYGLRAECVIYLNKDGGEGNRKYLVLTPDFYHKDNHIEIQFFYDTGETDERYPANSLGDYNGFNNVSARLPDTLEEIAALLRTY